MQTEILKVTGMTCGGCISTVEKVLKNISGVEDVNISLANGEVAVQFDERLTKPEQLKAAIQNAGYGIDTTNGVQKTQSKGGCCG